MVLDWDMDNIDIYCLNLKVKKLFMYKNCYKCILVGAIIIIHNNNVGNNHVAIDFLEKESQLLYKLLALKLNIIFKLCVTLPRHFYRLI